MKTAQWLKERASHLIEAQAYAEAIPYLERLLKLRNAGPYDLSFAHLMLGEIYLQEKHHRLAQEHLHRAMEISGESSRGLMLLGQAYCSDGKLRKGRDAIEAARRLAPGDEAVELSLGLCMCLQKEFDEAIEVYERCVKINPDRPEAYVGLAQSHAGRGELEHAREVLMEAKRRLPLSLTVRLSIKELDNLEEARDFCDWLIEQNFARTHENISPVEQATIPLARIAMVEYSFEPKAIQNAEKLWQDFLRVSQMRPRRSETWAGAIVYTMARLFNRTDIKQAALAKRFGVSPSSISAHFRKISRQLKVVKNDKRFCD